MANEISSMVTTTQSPAPARTSSQFVQLDTPKVSDTDGQALPQQGQALPQSGENSVESADLQQAISQINTFVQSVKRDLSFSLDVTSGRTVIKVIDSDSGTLVRQIPSEEVLALANYLQDVQQSSASVDGETPKGILFSDMT